MTDSKESPLLDAINIKYLLLGDLDTSKIITEFSTNLIEAKEKKNANQIFAKICKSNDRKFEERNKITTKDNCYYFTIQKPNILFIVYVDAAYPERFVFAMIDEIKNENILANVNEATKELDPLGRKQLKGIVDKYQDKDKLDKINEIQQDVNDIKVDVNDNINKMVQNIDDVNELQEKSDALKDASKDYHDNAQEVKQITWWQNFKIRIILILIILIVLGFILFAIFK